MKRGTKRSILVSIALQRMRSSMEEFKNWNMEHKIYFENSKGEQFMVQPLNNESSLDYVLDQLNISDFTIIDEANFDKSNKMTIGVEDEFSKEIIAHLTCPKMDLSLDDFGGDSLLKLNF